MAAANLPRSGWRSCQGRSPMSDDSTAPNQPVSAISGDDNNWPYSQRNRGTLLVLVALASLIPAGLSAWLLGRSITNEPYIPNLYFLPTTVIGVLTCLWVAKTANRDVAEMKRNKSNLRDQNLTGGAIAVAVQCLFTNILPLIAFLLAILLGMFVDRPVSPLN